MSDSGNSRHLTVTTDPSVPLTNLTAVGTRLDSLSRYLTESVNSNTVLPNHQIDSISSDLISAIHQVIINGAALLASQSPPPPPQPQPDPNPVRRKSTPIAVPDPKIDDDLEIVEVDAVELLAEHIHVCGVCGKGFKRDANLRMHMRAHGNQYKTPEALAKPTAITTSTAASTAVAAAANKRFSCPYVGCNRNKESGNFRPLKSVICVKNHFKRSHCPKMYTCNRCNRRSFSVVGDLRSHIRVCGESKWKCSCGTSFSRKVKLFDHVALFEGHMPSFDVSPAATAVAAVEEDEEEVDVIVSASAAGSSGSVLEFDDILEAFMGSYAMEEC